ncbi:patatin-like phospholipase family protein [Vagococcus fluvialis]|uniref:patatin-like phospholipase family protein n=1 Tax=Vagococcus fluvialis TaxID=2738 RepID=UPI001D0B5B24|nr:patatin-like phospholipase family protein [Vagococcus fluvialis]UDM78552.1 patatin-like phospholipase family protein [Vagococcus fluvialis]
MFKELYPSDITQLNFDHSEQWVPFFETPKLAIENLSQNIVKLEDDTYFYGCLEKHKIIKLFHVSVINQALVVHNIIQLITNEGDLNSHVYLIHLAKKHRLKKIVLSLKKQTSNIDNRLTSKGYFYEEEYGYSYQLEYNTGLVLGGGGAKGAYQIGVWHALVELGIKYTMISGTSVGALNGGLILQGNLEQAEKMWQKITTDQILLVSDMGERQDYSINQVLKEWRELTSIAIQSKGISTAPLLNLIREVTDSEKIISKDMDFFIVTTATPSMTETVVSLKDMTEETFPLWLLASASLFPAMEPCLIDETYYIDGCYCNNLPKDILIDNGASELIICDVKGTGVIKRIKTPNDITEITLRSPWTLGDVLLFDGNRSSWNMSLGYLETMKSFGHFKGEKYTFKKEKFKKSGLTLSREFFKFLSDIPEFEEWYQKKTTLKKWDWLQKNNQIPEIISIKLLESLAEKVSIEPIQVYEIEELIELLIEKTQAGLLLSDEISTNQMMKSIGELLSNYVRLKSPLTDYQLMMYYYRYFKRESYSNKEFFGFLMDVSWMNGLEALFLIFLEKRK